jgi:type III secretion protein W
MKKDEINAKIILLSQFRDAVRQVSAGKVYRSIQHRDELYSAILDALESLEDELEEELQKEENEADDEEEGKFVT